VLLMSANNNLGQASVRTAIRKRAPITQRGIIKAMAADSESGDTVKYIKYGLIAISIIIGFTGHIFYANLYGGVHAKYGVEKAREYGIILTIVAAGLNVLTYIGLNRFGLIYATKSLASGLFLSEAVWVGLAVAIPIVGWHVYKQGFPFKKCTEDSAVTSDVKKKAKAERATVVYWVVFVAAILSMLALGKNQMLKGPAGDAWVRKGVMGMRPKGPNVQLRSPITRRPPAASNNTTS
jgi:hypothetical protein